MGIEIAPAYYEDYLKKLYPEASIPPVDAFRNIDETLNFPEMSRLLTGIKDYRGEGIAAKLFYEGKVAEAVSMVVDYQKKHPVKPAHKLSQQDIESIRTVAQTVDYSTSSRFAELFRNSTGLLPLKYRKAAQRR